MRVLISNDDGINAPGIAFLAKVMRTVAQEVYVVAPASNQSAVSHSLSIRKDMLLKRVYFPAEVTEAYSLEGTPADCVKVGLNWVLRDKKPDFVITGMNNGYNAGFDTRYSGTIAGAIEGLYHGIPSIAVSAGRTVFGYRETDFPDIQAGPALTESRAGMNYGVSLPLEVVAEVLKEVMAERQLPDQLWNVNFPGCKKEDISGIYRTCLDSHSFFLDEYGGTRISDEETSIRLMDVLNDSPEEGSDIWSLNQNMISVTPISIAVLKNRL